VAVRRYLAQSEQSADSSGSTPFGGPDRSPGSPGAHDALGDGLSASPGSGLEEMPGVDTSVAEPTRHR